MGKIALGIDVAKGKSIVSAVGEDLAVLIKPYAVRHTALELKLLANSLNRMEGELRIILEATGHHHEPVVRALHEAGLFVSVVNPYLVKDFGNNTLRKVKTDRADAARIARYGMHYWRELRRYAPADEIRVRLKELNRQFIFYSDRKIAQQGHLIALLDRVFPGANKLFNTRVKSDGHMKWVDFVEEFWHCDSINQMNASDFAELYRDWCHKNGYTFTPAKAAEIHRKSSGHILTMPKDEHTKAIITAATRQLTANTREVEFLRGELCSLAEQLPEYPAVTALYGIGKSLAAQVMAEVGDVRNFKNGKALVAFAGIDPGRNQSGDHNTGSVAITKNGSLYLRKTLIYAMSTYILQQPPNEPVYLFYRKKREEGKHYFCCRTAAVNKFLRIYYARVKEYLEANDELTTDARLNVP
jgi:transposase